jgi:AraC family transcriptional regulator
MPTGSHVQAEIRSLDSSVQLVSHRWPTPVNTVFMEAEQQHVLALQQQPPQATSSGRYSHGQNFHAIGRVLAIPAGRSVHIRATGGTVSAVRYAFGHTVFERVGGRSLEHAGEAALDIRSNRVEQALRRLGEEASRPGFASAALVEGLGLTIMADLARYLDKTLAAPRPRRGGLSPRMLRQVTEYVEESTAAPTIEALAHLIGISPRHLSRAFRETTGRSVYEFIEDVRLRRAILLLSDTNLPLKDISFRLGFAHPCSFSTAFRKLQGETPLSYRRRVHPKNAVLKEDLRAAEREREAAMREDSRYTA